MEEEKKETKPVEKKEEKKVEDKKETKPVEKKEEKKVEAKKETKPVEKKEEKKVEAKKEEAKNKKSESQKTNNNSVIIAVVAVVVALLVIALAFSFMKDSPKKAVENTFNQLKTGAYMQDMLSGFLQEDEEFNVEAQKLLFEKLEWKILEEKEEGNTATVEVEITNKDFKTIMGNYMQRALKSAFSGQNVGEDEMTNYLIEELKNEEVSTVTNQKTINLEKQDGKWEVVAEDEFINAVLPGLYEAINALN